MLQFESDVQFSELIGQCIGLLANDKFDELFDVLANYEIPRQGSLVLAKAIWLRMKIDRMYEPMAPQDVEDKLESIRTALREAFDTLQDTYLNAGKAYYVSRHEFEVMQPARRPAGKDFVVRRKKNLDTFFGQKLISLDDFMAFVEDNGLVRLEDSGELGRLHGRQMTWEGKAGTVAQLNPHSPESDLYLIFWPASDKMFQLDPLVAFFSANHKAQMDRVVRGDKVVLRGIMEISREAPKIVLRQTELLQHLPREFGFSRF